MVQSCEDFQGVFDDLFEKFDLLYMDGLLSKTMHRGFHEVQVPMFLSIANIDWELAIGRYSFKLLFLTNLNDHFFKLLTEVLQHLSLLTGHCYLVKEICDTVGVLTEASAQYFEDYFKEILCTETQ